MERYIQGLSVKYSESEENIITDLNLEICNGDKIVIGGVNGSGKSTLLKVILKELFNKTAKQGNCLKSMISNINEITDFVGEWTGDGEVTSGLVVSYVNQDTSWMSGSLEEFCIA